MHSHIINKSNSVTKLESIANDHRFGDKSAVMHVHTQCLHLFVSDFSSVRDKVSKLGMHSQRRRVET